jgi:hypothetical protein
MSPAGPAEGTLALDLKSQDFQNLLSIVHDAGADLASRQAFGERLFAALFRDKVRDAWMASRGRLDGGEADGLRIRLWINAAQVAALPWELLYETDRGFMATAANLALSRYLPVPEPPAITVEKALRILVVVESPSNLTQIDPKEVDRLEEALEGLGSSVEYVILRDRSIPQIQNALQQSFHVLHFLGHGRAGKLALTGEGGAEAVYITDQEFAQLVQGRPALRLVVLNACYSSQPVEGHLFAGIGPSLVQKQMPAVVAMQYHMVSLSTAGRFSQALYQALGHGVPVDFAVNTARQQLSAGELLAQRDWSTPVLYMGTRNGRIVGLPGEGLEAFKQAAQQSDAAAAGLAELIGHVEELSQRSSRLLEWLRLETALSDLKRGIDGLDSIVSSKVRSLPRIDPIDMEVTLLGYNWNDLYQSCFSQMTAFMRSTEHISKPLSSGGDSLGSPSVHAWYQECQERDKELEVRMSELQLALREYSANPASSEAGNALSAILQGLASSCRSYRDLIRDRNNERRNQFVRETEDLRRRAYGLYEQWKTR